MAEKTPFANLYKWDKTDNKITTIDGISGNAEIIDQHLSDHKTRLDGVDTRLTTIDTKLVDLEDEIVSLDPIINQAIEVTGNAVDAANLANEAATNANTAAASAEEKATIAQSNAEQALTQANYAKEKADYIASKELDINRFTDETTSVQTQLNNIILESGTSDAEVVQARGTHAVLKERFDSLDEQLAQIAVNAAKYGLSESAAWEVNRDALQQANDYVASKGGGKVLIPTGIYTVKGVWQDSRVEFEGNGVTLVHPDGQNTDMIRSRVITTNGAITAGSYTLTVDSSKGIEKGSVIAIRGAGGLSSLQFTSLVDNITDTQTTGIKLTSMSGFANSGFLLVDSEIIEYTGQTNGELTGVVRGRYGTTPSSHAAGTYIGIAMRLIAEVMTVSGNTITLDRPAIIGVSVSPVSIGILHPKITGIKFEGNRVLGGASSTHNPVRWDLVRFGKVDFSAENAESAIYLSQGTRDCYGTIYAKHCSVPEGVKGAVVWLFQQCHRNHFYVNISGDLWSGVYLDNRTSLATEWDGSCNDNSGVVKVAGEKHTPWIANSALLIVGGNRNKYELNATRVRTGVVIESHAQVYTADGSLPTARGNIVDVRLHDVYQPWVLQSSGNTIMGYYESQANGTDDSANLKLAVSVRPGGDPVLGSFPDGTQQQVGLGFGSEPNTGFYKIAAGQVQFVTLGELIFRMRSTGFYMMEGKDFEFGTTTGTKIGRGATQKLGFWGATPVVRPSAIPDTSGATVETLEAEVNKLKSMLRSIGLMA